MFVNTFINIESFRLGPRSNTTIFANTRGLPALLNNVESVTQKICKENGNAEVSMFLAPLAFHNDKTVKSGLTFCDM